VKTISSYQCNKKNQVIGDFHWAFAVEWRISLITR
jgi:hypothetical protein